LKRKGAQRKGIKRDVEGVDAMTEERPPTSTSWSGEKRRDLYSAIEVRETDVVTREREAALVRDPAIREKRKSYKRRIVKQLGKQY